MPNASQTDAHPRTLRAPQTLANRRRRALRALLAALAAAPPHNGYCLWLGPCAPWRSSRVARKS